VATGITLLPVATVMETTTGANMAEETLTNTSCLKYKERLSVLTHSDLNQPAGWILIK